MGFYFKLHCEIMYAQKNLNVYFTHTVSFDCGKNLEMN